MLKKIAMNAAATMPSVKSHWKMPVPLPAHSRTQAFCEVERDNDAD
jgi:hypothetical protein